MAKAFSIHYLHRLPEKAELFRLFETTGWNEFYRLGESDLHEAAARSWHLLSAYSDDKLVGFGRIICDGVVHALILDLIVLPEFQERGIGGTILDSLVRKCLDHKIRDIQLFCAKGQAEFYKKRGFSPRPDNAPGMEYRQPGAVKPG